MVNKLRHWIVAAILTVGILTGCASPMAPTVRINTHLDAEVAAAGQLDPNLSPDVVAELHAEDGVTVIDVRETWEYEAGHIPGAVLLPLGELADRVDEIPEDTPVVLVCRSGNRSGQAFRFLQEQGFENVHNMNGGMLAWTRGDYPVEP